MIFLFLMSFFYFSFCNLETTQFVINVIGVKRKPMVLSNFAESFCYNVTLNSSLIKYFTLLIIVFVNRVFLHSLKCYTKFSMINLAEFDMIIDF